MTVLYVDQVQSTYLKFAPCFFQVCSLLWSPEYRELVSAHGFANNEAILFFL